MKMIYQNLVKFLRRTDCIFFFTEHHLAWKHSSIKLNTKIFMYSLHLVAACLLMHLKNLINYNSFVFAVANYEC